MGRMKEFLQELVDRVMGFREDNPGVSDVEVKEYLVRHIREVKGFPRSAVHVQWAQLAIDMVYEMEEEGA